MPRIVPALTRTAFVATTLLAGACFQSSDTAELGQVDLSLTGRAPSGVTYRLRNAVLRVDPIGNVFNTEDDPTRSVLSMPLEAGDYHLDLLDGWRMERVDASGVATNVQATLLSLDPAPFTIVSDQTTALALRFRVTGDGDVVTGPGGLDVSLEIEEGTSSPAQFKYVADRIELPTGNDTRLRLDIDGDGDAENKLGAILAALAQQSAGTVDLQGEIDDGVARGRSILLAGVRLDGTSATLTTYQGTSPDPAPCAGPDDQVCGGHLHGNATFTTAAEGRGVLVGAFSGGQLVAGPGTMRLVLPFAAAPLSLDLVSARVRMTGTPLEVTDGIVGGGITVASIQTQVIPWLTGIVQSAVARDCTGGAPPVCGCAAGSTGRTLLGLFDKAPVDCEISSTEVSSSPFIRTLLAPDLDLAAPVGEYDALSVGFGVTAVGAGFTP